MFFWWSSGCWQFDLWLLCISFYCLFPAWTSGSSRFTYCWSLAWRILSITLLAHELSAIVHPELLPLWGGHCWPIPPQETLKTQFWLNLCGVSRSWCAEGLFEPFKCLWQAWALILNEISPFLPSCWGFSFACRCGVSFLLVGSNILLLTVVQQRVVILEFSQEKMSTCPSTPQSSSTTLIKHFIFHLVKLKRIMAYRVVLLYTEKKSYWWQLDYGENYYTIEKKMCFKRSKYYRNRVLSRCSWRPS